jgi:glycosyltransferase involved in cell wall biosynthesis
MPVSFKKPLISFVIPTLNAEKVLDKCLRSIARQKTKLKYEIIIADGGSNDKTINIGKNYKARIISNPLKTAEAGKAVGVKYAKGKYICLIDSDNIIPTPNWLEKMILPFSDSKIIGTEPIRFTYRKNSGLIERYSALIGANDPYAFVTGIYDRQNYINFKWTGLKLETKDFKNYLKIKLEKNKAIPTIGANGTIFRKSLFKNFKLDFLFDIDLITNLLINSPTNSPLYFAKVNVGIIHTYCENSIKKFVRKQNRRIVDYYTYQNLRVFNWTTTSPTKFIFYTISVLPPIYHSLVGFLHKPDTAWFFHLPACFITLYVYLINFIKKKLNIIKPLNRDKWQQ